LLLEHLDNDSLEKFEVVKKILLDNSVPFEIDSKLVRGLDYYTETTFEIISKSVGSQSALCGGGRYDLLAEQIGDRKIPGVGFAAGIERILLACENEKIELTKNPSADLYIVRIDQNLMSKVYSIAVSLREQGLLVELDYAARSVKSQMREANKLGADFVLFVGGDEYKRGELLLKKMTDGSQQILNINSLNEIIKIIKG